MPAAVKATKVLLIEDEALIGFDLCESLIEAGFEVIGPAFTSKNAVALLNVQTPTLAIVDYFLQDGDCAELLHSLRLRGIPFLIYSGSVRNFWHRVADDAPWLDKPARPEQIVAALRMLEGHTGPDASSDFQR